MNRLVHLSLAVVLVAAAAVGCSGDAEVASEDGGAGDAVDGDPSWLFVVVGTDAAIDQQDERPRVTVTGLHDTIMFSDRPERLARRVAPEAVAAWWPDMFGDEPPNAVLTGITPDGAEFEVAVTLTEPAYTSTPERTLSFAIEPIGEDRDVALPSEVTTASLMIDDAQCPPGDAPGESCSTEVVYASTFVPFDSSF